MRTREARGKASATWAVGRGCAAFHGPDQGQRRGTAGKPSGAAPGEEAAKPTQEAAGPGQDDTAGDRAQQVLRPQAPDLVADPDLAGPLRGLHGQHPRPP